MTVANLTSLLTQGINDDVSYLELRAYLIDFKEEGGQPEQAISILKDLQAKVSTPAAKDRILELMDLVEGLGIKSLKIW